MHTGGVTFRHALAGEFRAALARAGHNQAWLAHNMGLSRMAVNSRLCGRVAMSAEELVDAAAALQLEPEALLQAARQRARQEALT